MTRDGGGWCRTCETRPCSCECVDREESRPCDCLSSDTMGTVDRCPACAYVEGAAVMAGIIALGEWARRARDRDEAAYYVR